MIGLGGPLATTTCSRAGCRNEAGWRLDWRNPRIHTPDRVKTWLACAEHADYLREFLAARDFPLTVRPLPATDGVTAQADVTAPADTAADAAAAS